MRKKMTVLVKTSDEKHVKKIVKISFVPQQGMRLWLNCGLNNLPVTVIKTDWDERSNKVHIFTTSKYDSSLFVCKGSKAIIF